MVDLTVPESTEENVRFAVEHGMHAVVGTTGWDADKLGRLEEAESLCTQSLEMHQRIYRGDHIGVAMSLLNLAKVRRALHKPAEARQSIDPAVAMFRRLTPDGSSPLVQCLRQSAALHLDDGDAAAALPDLEEAVALGEKSLSPEDSELQHCREMLVSCKQALATAESE